MRNAVERLLNLLAYLLTVSRPVAAEDIRRTVPGYSQESDDAFHRMFERDKDVLRRIGIPLELKAVDGWEIEHGYQIDPNRYRLPDPGLTDDERAALWLAAQAVHLGGRPAGPEAILKLGGTSLAEGIEPLAADLGQGGEVLGELFDALSDRRPVAFSYASQTRRVAPYGLGHRRGHWYLAGEAGQGLRIFRVDRIEDLQIEGDANSYKLPKGFRLREALETEPWEAGTEAPLQARVRFFPDSAWWARRRLGHRPVESQPDGGLISVLTVTNRDAFLGWVLSFGDEAEVLEPPVLRAAVINRVKGRA
jgi:proteasome accessory factor B